MSKPIYDYSSEEFLYNLPDDTAFDSTGSMMIRMSDVMAMDIKKTGELHIVSSWENDDD